ncbi:NADP oxidoreductase [Streptomyces sp. me109]|uniref:NADPH-dependent F420 reductase n=1 Tax=Streptomyces sp. me109 TaxID=1827853 RepID=UPI0011CE2DD8|nr:NAD(P)-binding domain-containing protein [Streptomyces sp. me109]TXS54860.1 NADP oxidoreductase [Streptomyces sp. me109]
MKIGTIGAGTVATAFARQALTAGHQVVLSNSRGPASLQQLVTELGRGASAGTREEAAAAEMVLLAVPWPVVPRALDALTAWDGRILIDATNQFASLAPVVIDDLGDTTGSEFVAELAPGARVVKAFNTLFAEYIAVPRRAAGRVVLFHAGDDVAAKATVASLADRFGFAPLDVGGLRSGGQLMQLGGSLSAQHLLHPEPLERL